MPLLQSTYGDPGVTELESFEAHGTTSGSLTGNLNSLDGGGRRVGALTGVTLPHVFAAEDNTIRIALIGAGGRGVMTIAALNDYSNIRYIVDKNPKSDDIFAPKSHLPVYDIDMLGKDRASKILVFSFGYYNLCNFSFFFNFM